MKTIKLVIVLFVLLLAFSSLAVVIATKKRKNNSLTNSKNTKNRPTTTNKTTKGLGTPSASSSSSVTIPNTSTMTEEEIKLWHLLPENNESFDAIETRTWYSTEHIRRLVRIYNMQDHALVLPTQSINTTTTFTTIITNTIGYLSAQNPHVLAPIQINGNHWILLFLRYNLGERHITCFDSSKYRQAVDEYSPFDSEEEFEKSWVEFLSDGEVFDSFNFQRGLQTDGYNCGTWMIEAMRHFIAHPQDPMPLDLNIADSRREHSRLLEPEFEEQDFESILDRASALPHEPASASHSSSSSSESSSSTTTDEPQKKKRKPNEFETISREQFTIHYEPKQRRVNNVGLSIHHRKIHLKDEYELNGLYFSNSESRFPSSDLSNINELSIHDLITKRCIGKDRVLKGVLHLSFTDGSNAHLNINSESRLRHGSMVILSDEEQQERDSSNKKIKKKNRKINKKKPKAGAGSIIRTNQIVLGEEFNDGVTSLPFDCNNPNTIMVDKNNYNNRSENTPANASNATMVPTSDSTVNELCSLVNLLPQFNILSYPSYLPQLLPFFQQFGNFQIIPSNSNIFYQPVEVQQPDSIPSNYVPPPESTVQVNSLLETNNGQSESASTNEEEPNFASQNNANLSEQLGDPFCLWLDKQSH